MGHAAENRGVGDLVAVQVQDGQHGAVALGVQELVGLPAGGQRAGLSLAVAHRDRGDQVGVVKDSAEGMGDGVAQLAAFIDGARGLGRHVAGDAAREAELLEQPAHAFLVTADVGVDLAVGAVQVGVGHKEVAAVARTGDQDEVLVILLDNAVQVHVDKVLTGYGAPVPDNLLLHIVAGERTAQERIVQQVELSRCQVVGSTPVGVDLLQFGAVHDHLSFLNKFGPRVILSPFFIFYHTAHSACRQAIRHKVFACFSFLPGRSGFFQHKKGQPPESGCPATDKIWITTESVPGRGPCTDGRSSARKHPWPYPAGPPRPSG